MRRTVQKGVALALLSGALPGMAFAASAPATAPVVIAGGPITRGAFASMLVSAAGLGSASATPDQAAKILVSQGIMKGYAGSLHLSQPVTAYQAAVMVGRALGYPSEMAPTAGSGGSAWGANRVAWLEHEGLLPAGSPSGTESMSGANNLLNGAFGSSQQAQTLMQSTQHTTPVPLTMSGTVSGTFTTTFPGSTSLPAGSPSSLTTHVDATMTARVNSQGDMHLTMTENVSAPGMPGAPTGGTTFQLSEYLINNHMYMEMTLPTALVQPGQSATTWAQMTMPSATSMMQQGMPINMAFLKNGHLRVLSTGSSTSTLAFSMAMTNPQSVMALLPGLGGASGALQSALSGVFQVLKAVYVHGQVTVNSQEHLATGLTIRGEIVGHQHVPTGAPVISGAMTEQVTVAPTADAPIQLPAAAAGAIQLPTPSFLSGGSPSSSSSTGG